MPEYIVFVHATEYHLVSYKKSEANGHRHAQTMCGIMPNITDRIVYKKKPSINICQKCQRLRRQGTRGA